MNDRLSQLSAALVFVAALVIVALLLVAGATSQPECGPEGCPLERPGHERTPDRPPDACGQTASTLLDLPPELRTRNYAGGSCCHAAMIDVLRWHGFDETADWWRKRYWGAEGVEGLSQKLQRLGFRFAYTTSGNAEFLEWCARNRHGAAIHYYPRHAITFRGYQGGYAVLQDNNRPDRLIRVEKRTFIENWKAYGGRALTLVYSPAPPTPHI